MTEKASALFSAYVIDGIQQELTPARLLEAVSGDGVLVQHEDEKPSLVVDESIDSIGSSVVPDSSSPLSFLDGVKRCLGDIPLHYASACTRVRIASAVIDSLWKDGRFSIGNLSLEAKWLVNREKVGSMAAFYESVQSASEYVDALCMHFSRCDTAESDSFGMEFLAVLSGADRSEDEPFVAEPFVSPDPWMRQDRICGGKMIPDCKSWVVYIPFDTADFRLGGSAFASAEGVAAAPPRIEDADYFMDCFEVVREFAEDGVLLSAATVGRGGLLKAVDDMISGSGCGLEMNVSDIMRAYQESSPIDVLFSEVPGVVIQIRDSDFDYLDAELLLQDVAYYPLGHPVHGAGIGVCATRKPGIETILDSLMQNAEGED